MAHLDCFYPLMTFQFRDRFNLIIPTGVIFFILYLKRTYLSALGSMMAGVPG